MFPFGRVMVVTSVYFWMLPLETVAISSLTSWSFSISVLADTKVPNVCSMADLNALLTASVLLLPSAETTNDTSDWILLVFSSLLIVLGSDLVSGGLLDAIFCPQYFFMSLFICLHSFLYSHLFSILIHIYMYLFLYTL